MTAIRSRCPHLLKVLGLWLLGIFGACVAVILLVAVVAVEFPQALLNDRTLDWAGRFARAHGQNIHWKSAHIEVESRSLLSKIISVRFDDVCANLESGAISACFDHLEFSAGASLKDWAPHVTDVGPGKFVGGVFTLESRAEPPLKPATKPKQGESVLPTLPAFLSSARIHPLSIEMKKLKVAGFDGAVTVSAQEGANGEEDIALTATALAPTRDQLNATLALRNPSGLLELKGWAMRLAAGVRRPDGTRVSVRGQFWPLARSRAAGGLTLASLQYGYGLDAEYDLAGKGNPRIRARLDGEIRDAGIQVRVNGAAEHLAQNLTRIRVKDCNLAVSPRVPGPIETSRERGTHLKVDCPVFATIPPELRREDFGPGASGLPEEAGATLRLDADSPSFPPDLGQNLTATAAVELNPVETPLFQASGGVRTTISHFVPSEFPEGFHHDTDVGFRVWMPRFERVVAALARSDFAVWAPVRALDGTIDFHVQGKLDTDHGEVPFQLATRLSSPSQKLDLDASGLLTLAQLQRLSAPRELHASIDLVLSDVQLELPRLGLQAPPRFTPDSRIAVAAPAAVPPYAKESSGPVFSYDLKVRTTDAKPVRILTNLAEKAIPIRFQVEMKSEPPPAASSIGGVIQVRNFPVEFFHRQATVDHFNLALKQPTSDSGVDGEVRIKYTDYTVIINVVGTAAKPQIVLAADPPLSQDQIVAVLLYGRTMDELDPDQASSVGSTQAAVADRALGLLSLYALASTPIQSVGYDPSTGEVLVKVRLGEGTSLNLGDQPGGTQDIGIQHRLSKHWSVSTDLNPPSAATGNRSVLSALLEWSNRY